MRIKCIRGTAINLRSVGSTPVTVHYKDLGNQTLVHSELNGSGKTTMFVQLIVYAVTGKPYNNKSKVGNLINLKNGKGLIVEFEFMVGPDTFIIRRGQKPKLFELYKNTKLLDTNVDYQSQLNDIIGKDVSFNMLVNTIILSNSRYTPFRLQTKKQREDFLDVIFRTHVYNPMLAESKLEIKGMTAKVEDITTRISHIKNLMESTSKAICEFKDTKKGLGKELKIKLKQLQSELSTNKKLSEKLQFDDTKLIQISTQFATISNEKNLLESSMKEEMIKQQQKMKILRIDNCPTCKQDVSTKLKTNIKKEVQKELTRLKPIQEQLGLMESKLKQLQQDIDVEKTKQNEYNTNVNELNSSRSAINYNIRTIEEQLKSQDSNIDETIKEYTLQLKTQQEGKTKLDIKLSEYSEELAKFSTGNKFLLEVNIRQEIMAKYIKYINNKLNNFLQEMEFFIEVVIDEKYDIFVKSVSKQGLSIHDLSDGERSKIDLAFILVWKKLQDEMTQDLIDIFILDETLANFSPQAVKDFLTLMRKELPNHKIIVILQHPNDFIESFDNVIEMKLEDDFTYIYEEKYDNANILDVFNIRKS